MIKRDITETVYEYDKDGKLVRKTVTTTHETDDETRYPSYPSFTASANSCCCSSSGVMSY